MTDRPSIPIPSWLPILLAVITPGVAGVVYVEGIKSSAAVNRAALVEAKADRADLRSTVTTAVTEIAVIQSRLANDGDLTRAEIGRLQSRLDRLQDEMRESLR